MIQIFTTSGGSGGGGAGTVTSVGSSSNSLANNSAPNPIVGAGNISFEVQIINVTYVQAALLELGNGLLPGVTYRITDFGHTIGNVNLRRAEFITLVDSNGDRKFNVNGTAYAAVSQLPYQISYDLQTDFLMSVYLSTTNQKASRSLGSVANCIEKIDWENTNWQNVELIECDILGITASCQILYTFGNGATINFGSVDGILQQSVMLPGSAVTFLDSKTVFNVQMLQDSALSVEEDATNGIIEASGSLSVLPLFPIDTFRVGSGQIVFSNNSITQRFTASDFNNNEAVQVFTAVVIAEQILSSLCTNINVNIDPSAFAVGYSINLPQFPYNRQIVNIGWNAACATATGIVTATFAAGGVIVPLLASQKGQCISYIYESVTATWYLI